MKELTIVLQGSETEMSAALSALSRWVLEAGPTGQGLDVIGGDGLASYTADWTNPETGDPIPGGPGVGPAPAAPAPADSQEG